MMPSAHVPLRYGLVADVVTEESDRPAVYVPPPVTPGAHADACGCLDCLVKKHKGTRTP